MEILSHIHNLIKYIFCLPITGGDSVASCVTIIYYAVPFISLQEQFPLRSSSLHQHSTCCPSNLCQTLSPKANAT